MNKLKAFQQEIAAGIPDSLPAAPDYPVSSRTPRRPAVLSRAEQELALANVLRYFPAHRHAVLAPELSASWRGARYAAR